MHEEVIVSERPYCDFCAQAGTQRRANYDGKTTLGPWANMCERHFKAYGVGLGLGRGQRLVVLEVS